MKLWAEIVMLVASIVWGGLALGAALGSDLAPWSLDPRCIAAGAWTMFVCSSFRADRLSAEIRELRGR